eukprot:3758813-Amphidinium_carterae.1
MVFMIIATPLDRGVRGVDYPKPVNVQARVERQRGWEESRTLSVRLGPLGSSAASTLDLRTP